MNYRTGIQKATVKQAKRAIMWSWIVTVGVSIFLVPIILQAENTSTMERIGLSLFSIYAAWATFWGWKVVWPRWRELRNRIGFSLIVGLRTWILISIVFFYIPFVGAYMYGCLGGGIYQYLKYRRIAK